MEEIQSMLVAGARASTVSGRLSRRAFPGDSSITSARIALDIRHQLIAERDESRIVLPKRPVNEIPSLPLGTAS